ncbi:MAG: hypothetical protein O6913_12375 [Chloroflexi bacterium]|nr:hypothetical protein [Chloroflexota bacterium]MCZ6706624.1 hypothetical protein [Chloroflexota bacterium]
MGAFQILLILIMVLGLFYLFGLISVPWGSLMKVYYRIRLVGLLWAVAIILIGASRALGFP